MFSPHHTQYCDPTARSLNHWQHGATVLLVQTSAAVTVSNLAVEAEDVCAATQAGLAHRWMPLTYSTVRMYVSAGAH